MTSVVAAPPIKDITFSTGTTLQIATPSFQYYQYGVPIKLHIHVFNHNTTYPLNNATTQCYVHTYNQSAHIEKLLMEYSTSDLFDYEVSLNISKYPRGIYGTIYSCNNSIYGGFKDTGFEITDFNKHGIPIIEKVNNQATTGIIIGIVLIAMLFLYFAFKLNDDHFILKLILIFMFFFAIMIIPSAVLTGFYDAGVSIMQLVQWGFGIFVAYFAFYIAYFYLKKSELFLRIFK